MADGNSEAEGSTSPHSRGFDCSVSGHSPRAKEAYQCSICLLFYREPHLMSCCGAHFCHYCIASVKDQGKPCPLCQESGFTTMLDKALRREVLNLEVSCTYRDVGCVWRGRLKDLEPHTDVCSGMCEYVPVSCKWNCGEMIQKKAVGDHEQNRCVNRPWYLDLDDPQVQLLAERVHKLEEVNVSLQNEVKSIQMQLRVAKNENEKLKSDIEELGIQQSARDQRFEDLVVKMSCVVTEIQKLKDENAHFKETIAQLTLKQGIRIQDSETREYNEERGTVDDSPAQSTYSSPDSSLSSGSTSRRYSLAPFSFTMKSFAHRKQQKVIWFSPPFYSHSCGYKMQLRVDANGTQDGKDSHLSVYVYLMKGDFDDELPWPFRGNVTVRIVNQLEDSNHYERVIDFPKGTNPLSVDRVTVGSRVKAGHGYSQFIPHLDLSYDRHCQYLKDDCIKFVVFVTAETSSSLMKPSIPIIGRFLK